MITWHPPIWIDLWFAGMAGGAYFAAFLAERFAGVTNRRLLQVATCLGIPLASTGVLLLIVDLGQPIRFWHLLARFEILSPMSMGTWILMVWVIVAMAMVALWLGELYIPGLATLRLGPLNLRRMVEILSWVGLVFAALLMTYTGVLLATSNQPLWAGTVLLPPLFVASAISTGVALLIVAAVTVRALGIPSRTVNRLAEAVAVVILIELAVLVGYGIWLGVSPMEGTGEALRLLTTGVLAAPFWVGVVLLALLVPLALQVANWGQELERKAVWRAVLASAVCVIFGGLVLRAVITIGGQM
jgi:formate-dependent nitrite reductase membrane component NrfD